MGKTRNNQSRAVTEEKIRNLIRDLVVQEQTVFPSERELSARVGGSRTVIREILEKLEQEKKLLKTPNGRAVNPQTNQIRVLFIAHGRNMIGNPAWARLWQAFQIQTKNTILTPELHLVRYWPEEIEEDIRKLMRDPARYAVICSDKYMEPLIRHWIGKKKNLIFTDEAYLHYGQPVIALNNEKVGEMAAEELFRYGFRSPALLTPDYSDQSYSPFTKRIEAFSRKCAELGMDFRPEQDIYRVFFQKGHLQNYIWQTMKIAQEKRYDSLFLTTDDNLPLVLEVLNEQQRPVPGEDLGLITLNAQNNAETSVTRVNSISHVTDETAACLVKNILAHADGLISEIPTISIKPTIHEGETLCLRKKKK